MIKLNNGELIGIISKFKNNNLDNYVYPDLHDMKIFGSAEIDVDLVISLFYCEGKIENKVIKNKYGN